jgi:putative DNA primase/helicase
LFTTFASLFLSYLEDPGSTSGVYFFLQRQFDRIEYDRNALWGYTNGIYREIQQPFIEQIVASYDGYGIGSEETAPDELKPFRANYSRMQGVYQCLLSTTKNKAIARDYEEMLNHGSERYFEPGFFNNAASGIPFRNGFVRLNPTTHEVEVLPHSTEHRALFALPFDYTPGVDTPLWNKYLCDVWNNYDSAEQASRVYFLEEWIGATLLGDITKHALCVLWVGSGSNGKSVGLETISGLFHAETICSVAPQRWNNPFELVRLAGKKLNVCEETPNVKIAGPDIFKAVTSGSPVEACKKHQDFYRFKPTAGHIFALNTLHGTNDHSEGYWRRLAPLAFDRKFDAKTADVDFGRKLAKETPGIAALVVEAASRLAKRGHFNIPQSVSEYKEAWRAETNQYLQFIGERWNDLSEQHGESIPGKVLYSAFYEWSKSNGHREPPGNNTFSNELERLGYKKVRRNTGVIWYKQ